MYHIIAKQENLLSTQSTESNESHQNWNNQVVDIFKMAK